MKALKFVILSLIIGHVFGESPKNNVNLYGNLNVDMSVINDSIHKIRQDFDEYKRLTKIEYEGKIEAINQENDGRFQSLQIFAGLFVTLIIAFLAFAKYEVNEKIKSSVIIVFDERFDKNKIRIEEIRDEATDLLQKIKEIQTSALLEKQKINSEDIQREIEQKIKTKKNS